LFVLVSGSLFGKVPIQMGQAFWNGEKLVFFKDSKIEASVMRAANRKVPETTVFFQPIHSQV
jgi:hypothetical protein